MLRTRPATTTRLWKPHHFVDIICRLSEPNPTFEPHRYGHAVHTVAHAVIEDRDAPLRIELGADDICAPCRHCIDGQCDDTIDTSFRPDAPTSKMAWNWTIDERWCRLLGIAQDDRLTARKLCRLILDHLPEMAPIYREEPADHTARRKARLEAGAQAFLAE